MKLFPNLAGSLRLYFGWARALTLVFSACWILALVFGPLLHPLVGRDAKLMVSVGDVSIHTKQNPLTLSSDVAPAGSLAMNGLRGTFQADLLTDDSALRSALRWTVLPVVFVLAGFAWFLFSALRAICANIERHDIFSESNLNLLRRAGLTIIVSSIVSFALQFFAARVMGGYIAAHVTATGLPISQGEVHFSFPGGIFPSEFGIVTGLVVLLLTQAFRQGLQLKTENDLTV